MGVQTIDAKGSDVERRPALVNNTASECSVGKFWIGCQNPVSSRAAQKLTAAAVLNKPSLGKFLFGSEEEVI